MKILIIEDEKHNASRMQRLLTEISSTFEVLDILETVDKSVIWLKNNPQPDVILMDIRLSDGLSFDIFEKVEVNSPIIFTTSYDEYEIRAFKVNSVDYLLKPIEKEELANALEKVELEKKKVSPPYQIEQLLDLFKEHQTIYRKRFLLPKSNGYKIVMVSDIKYIFTDQKITYLATNEGYNEIIGLTMDELEDELDPSIFFRANRQFIVHIDNVSTIKNDINGKLRLLLKDKNIEEIIVSREKAPFLKKWLDR